MKFTLEITDMEGAAFQEAGPCFEVADILAKAAQRVREGHMDAGVLRDANGNKVGRYITTDDSDGEWDE